jgi:HEAT repeat protein
MSESKRTERTKARFEATVSIPTDLEGVEGLCGTPGQEAAPASVLRRMVEESPPFRPDATPEELVDEFANGKNRVAAYLALYQRGQQALPAVRKGFKQTNWQVRKWCTLFADNFADAETLHAMAPLVQDPKSDVRRCAVHSISCESCKDGPNPIDAIPLLLQRIERDESIRVRRQAVGMLAHHRSPDPRVLPVFKQLLADEDDRKLRLHAEHGLKRYAREGLAD